MIDSIIISNVLAQLTLFFVAILILIKPLGIYISKVFTAKAPFLERFLSPLERLLYKLSRIDSQKEMNWKEYAFAVLTFSLIGVIFLYCLLRLQAFLPLNPESFPALSEHLAFNTAASFVTNTNWQ